MNILYYESHITVEPVFDDRLDKFKEICLKYKFKAADLLFQKRKQDTPTRSSKDTFCTSRGTKIDELKQRMEQLTEELKNENYKVWRQKIEAVIIDKKFLKE